MTKTPVRIAALYSLFAVISVIINIGSQIVTISIYDGVYAIEISILVGTITGLPLRYLLEKRYIFDFTTRNLTHDGKLFLFYSSMSIITTLVFWATEYAFHLIFDSAILRYIGGILGLTFGFYMKYLLDKRYVFVQSDFGEKI